ncbi:MAG: DUF397 domain-containing protein [Streptosporangiaceae bacterium]|jgi:hypothetical protein
MSDNKEYTDARTKWRKSSFSGSMGDCIEVSSLNQISVRDSKASSGPYLRFSSGAWKTFIRDVRNSHSTGKNLTR